MKYYDEYVKNLPDDHINKYLAMAFKRVERFKQDYRYNPDLPNAIIDFIHSQVYVPGTTGYEPLQLLPYQKAFIEVTFGFVNKETGLRVIKEAPLLVARGSGKTTFAAALALSFAMVGGPRFQNIQVLANTVEQAGLLMSYAVQMCNYEGSELNGACSTAARKIDVMPTDNVIKVKTSSYKSLDGTNSVLNIFDEVHAYDKEFIKIVNDGSSRKQKEWTTLYITTNGTLRGKVFDRYFDLWADTLKKDNDDSIFPFIYCLDEFAEMSDEKYWNKSMPGLGILFDHEVIRRELRLAEEDIVAKVELAAKTFNIPMNAAGSYFDEMEIVRACKTGTNQLFECDESQPVIIGLDVSQVSDICSVAFMIPDGDKYNFRTLNFLPRQRVELLTLERRLEYEALEYNGDIFLHDAPINDAQIIFKMVFDFIDRNNLQPVAIGFDPWNAYGFVTQFENWYGKIATPVYQTVKVLSPALKTYKGLLISDKINFEGDLIKQAHINVVTKIDANGNLFPNKSLTREKIDPFMAQLDALIIYLLKQDELAIYFDAEYDPYGWLGSVKAEIDKN